MPVSLTTAKPGDRFEARDGEVWTYVRLYDIRPTFHLLRGSNGCVTSFAPDGKHYNHVKHHDLVRALDSPAPAPAEPMGDVGLVEELKAAAVPFKPGVPGVLPSRALYGQAATRIEALTAELQRCGNALRDETEARLDAEAALDEARKVIEKSGADERAKIAASVHILRHHCFWLPDYGYGTPHQDEAQRAIDGTLDRVASQITREDRRREYEERQAKAAEEKPDAARDWHSKHGGAADA